MAGALVALQAIESFAGGSYQAMRGVTWAVQGEFQLVVVHGRRSDTPLDATADFPPGTRFVDWPVHRELSVSQDARALRALRRMVTSIRPAVVHAHSSKAGALARIACLGTESSVLYSPHGYAFQRRDVNRLVRYGYWGMEWLIGQLPHHTVACGPSEFAQARQLVRDVTQVPNGINLQAIDAALLMRPGRRTPPLVVGAGRITPQKDFGTFRALSRDSRLGGADFCWLGGPSVGMRDTGRVVISGWLNQPDLYRRLAEASVFVLPSLWEGLPLIVLEVMSVGLPVIARPIPGVTDLIRDGVNGLLRETPEQFGSAVKQLLDDPALARRLGEAGRRLVEEHHSGERLAERWRSLYRRIGRVHIDQGAE